MRPPSCTSGIDSAVSNQRARILRAEADYDSEIIEARDLKRVRDAAEARIQELEAERLMQSRAGALSPILGVDDLSDEDKLVVARARKVEQFLTQPMFVARQFTGREGRYVKIQDTVRGFRLILDGEVDHIPEPLFYLAGSMDDVFERYEAYERELA